MKTARGTRSLAFLLIAIATAGTALFLTTSASPEERRARAPALDPLSEAKIAFVDGDFAAAERILRDRQEPEARTLLARVLLERGRNEEASLLFGEILKEDPKNFEAARGLASASRNLGRLEFAIHCWSRAAELRKDDPRVWRELGLCQREKGDALSAMSSLQQSLRIDQNQADLSALITQLATGIHEPAAFPTATGRKPEDPLSLRTVHPAGPAVPRPRVPDPTQNSPWPGTRSR